MLITDPDDLYSAMMDAMEDLRPEFVVKCSNDFYKLMLHYSHIWNDGIKSTSYNWKESSDTSLGKNTRVLEVTVKLSYLLEYQIEMAPHSKESTKNADKEAVEYSKKVDKIMMKAYSKKEEPWRGKMRHRAIVWSVPAHYYANFSNWLANCWGIDVLVEMESLNFTKPLETEDHEEALKDIISPNKPSPRYPLSFFTKIISPTF